MNQKSLAHRIDQAIRKTGDGNPIIGERCGVSGEAVRLWRKGHTIPHLNHIQVLAKVVGVSADWLLVGYDKEESVGVNDIPARDVDLARRIGKLRPEIRVLIEALTNELTSPPNFEYASNQNKTIHAVHDEGSKNTHKD